MQSKPRRRRVFKQGSDINFDAPVNQEEFARLVGWTQQNISLLCEYNVLNPGGSFRDWLQQFARFQFGIIYARHGFRGLARANGETER